MMRMTLKNSMGFGKSVCYGCEKRTVTCHSDCKDYIDEAKARREEPERRHREIAANRVVTDVLLRDHKPAKDTLNRRSRGYKKY